MLKRLYKQDMRLIQAIKLNYNINMCVFKGSKEVTGNYAASQGKTVNK